MAHRRMNKQQQLPEMQRELRFLKHLEQREKLVALGFAVLLSIGFTNAARLARFSSSSAGGGGGGGGGGGAGAGTVGAVRGIS